MTTKKQLAALAKGREKLAKSRKLNGLKDLFKSKKDKPTEAKKTVKKTVKKSSKATATAKKAVRKQLSETKKKVRKATTKIFNEAKKKANKTTKKALDATKKTLAKKGLAGAKQAEILSEGDLYRLTSQLKSIRYSFIAAGQKAVTKRTQNKMFSISKDLRKQHNALIKFFEVYLNIRNDSEIKYL